MTYVLSVLSRGVATGVAVTLRTGDLAGLARALAIVAGFAITVAGYSVGSAAGLVGMLTNKRRMANGHKLNKGSVRRIVETLKRVGSGASEC